MATVSRGLPDRPHLDVPKREARELLGEWRKGDAEAVERIRHRHPRFRSADDSAIATGPFRLSDAQLVIAREYGFAHWTELKQRIETNAAAHELLVAIRDDDRDAAVRIVRAEPRLLHVPLWSGNWGPPMSHAANLGRLAIIEAMADLGAKDFQHAFDRAVLQGRIESARWLHAHGATLAPGIIMGSCETLNAAGFDFLADLGAPLTNEQGDRLAPLALVLETYSRLPAGKHAILDSLARHGYDLPDTPIMAFHRGSVADLEGHLRRDPSLLARRFSLREIYPPELGCKEDGPPGMHWTPIDGTTLLHLAIDFYEREIFDWLLARGADVDARANVDAEGFGGHTPLFHTVVCGPWGDETFIRALLERGASADARASLRKFLDWRAQPHWHEARDVTAAEWGRGFPDQGWVNDAALRILG
ncbi:MAG TPA: ankyrin repeat domain-containing protein [Gemmatimonadaceae bacterium]|nr:ankyrin repeat domain-containing protein [Gemmatimonadaceae bacterium]